MANTDKSPDPTPDTESSEPQAASAKNGNGQAEAEVVEAATQPAEVAVADGGAEEAVDPLEQSKQETERMRNQMLRIAADFENFRKRSRREIEDAARRAREDFLRDMLPVFDNLERASAHAEGAAEARAVADGVKMVLRQFHDTLANLGVSRIKTVGVPFDPNVHEAIQQIATTEHSPGTVAAEVLAGYLWEERLVRAAMVVVAKAPPTPEQEPSASPSPEPETSA